MPLKVYNKAGKHNYKESKLEKEIIRALEEKAEKNPDILKDFRPADSFEELEALYQKYAIDDVQFEEIKDNKPAANDQPPQTVQQEPATQNNTPMSGEKNNPPANLFDNTGSNPTDPFNKEEPIVRDYVQGQDFPDQKGPNPQGQTIFSEPRTFSEAFEMPKDNPNTGQPNSGGGGGKSGGQKAQPSPNPDFDQLAAGKKRRSVKRFAKYIVETIVFLQEKGFVWYANKDINEAKLIEYELKGEIDLNLLVTLDEGQATTVREFFRKMCSDAEEAAKIPQEKVDDLIDALAEVMLEKNVGPTPTQELMMVALSTLGMQVIKLVALRSMTSSVLVQLKAMKAEEQPYEDVSNGNTPPAHKQEPEKKEAPPAPPRKQQTQRKAEDYEQVFGSSGINQQNSSVSPVEEAIASEEAALSGGVREGDFEELAGNKIMESAVETIE